MPQIFRKSANSLARASLVFALFIAIFLVIAYYLFWHSSYVTHVGIVQVQPVLFSHRHHVKGMKLDCRFCHSSVEEAANAGMPSTEVCMSCHSQIFTNSPVLKPVVDSFHYQTPLRWTRVHQLPDFVYFNHSMHIHAGVACINCHGHIDEMPLTSQAKSLTMEFCIDCHAHPEPSMGPREKVFSMNEKDNELALKGFTPEAIDHSRMRNCYECHR